MSCSGVALPHWLRNHMIILVMALLLRTAAAASTPNCSPVRDKLPDPTTTADLLEPSSKYALG